MSASHNEQAGGLVSTERQLSFRYSQSQLGEHINEIPIFPVTAVGEY